MTATGPLSPAQAPPNGTTDRPHTRSSLLLAFVVPVAAIAASALIAWSWRADLPDPVAQHWDGVGNPDGFGSLGGTIAVAVGFTLAFAIGFTALAVYSPAARRMAIATSWSLSALFSSVTLVSLWRQRGLADAAEATDAGWTVAIAIGLMVLFGVIGFLISPRDLAEEARSPLPAEVADDALVLSDGERVAWHGTLGAGSTVYMGMVGVAATALLTFMTRMWAIAVVPLILAVFVAAFVLFRVRISRTGVEAKSALGWPRKSIPLGTITRAAVTHTSPLREFGGWGWRTGRGNQVGIVTRKGESLTIEHSGGQRFVLTVDEAATAAATLNGLIARERGVATQD